MTGSSPSTSIRLRWALAGAFAALLACWHAAPAEDIATEPPATTAPTTAPATSPLDLIAATSRPKLEPIERAETVREALDYTDDERTILEDVRDGDGQLDTAALGVLLRRASMLPRDPTPMEEADRPNVRNFWLEPGGYRGKLLAVETGYVEHEDCTRRIAFTRWWGRRAVYIVTVSVKVGDELQSMIVMTPEEPPAGLKKGQRLRFAGLFYKLARLTERGYEEEDGPTELYPVLVARSVRPGQTSGGGPAAVSGPPLPLMLAFLGIVVLLFLFFLLRKQIQRGPDKKVEYKPLRYGEADDVRRPSAAAPGEPVDEELVRQVKEYRKEHGEDEEASDDG